MYSVEDLLIAHGYKPSRTMVPAESGSGSAHRRTADTPAEDAGQLGERNRRSQETTGSNQSNTRSQGESLSNSAASQYWKQGRLCHPSTEKEVSYWRRKGQDFSALLDYADVQRPCGLDRRKKPQGGDEVPWLRDSEVEGLQPWRMTADRRWQSLGMEEWRPAVGLGRQLSDGLSDRWAQEQCHPKTAEGVVHLTSKGKSQSLPKGLLSDSLQYTSVPVTGSSIYSSQHVDATDFLGPYTKHQRSGNGQEQWTETGEPPGLTSLFPKPRVTRSVKTPTYDVHQQAKGSLEMLVGDLEPRSRNRVTCLPIGREVRQDCITEPEGSCLGPPGYIPPPSYKRRIQQDYNKVTNLQYKAEMGPRTCEAQKWFCRPSGSWVSYEGSRSIPCGKPAYPGYLEQHLGCVQYLPFSDPRVHHISGVHCANSLTDSDKMRKIHTEIPTAKVLGQSAYDSAFHSSKGLIPNRDNNKLSPHENNSSSRLYSSLHKENNNFFSVDHNCNEYHAEHPTISSTQNDNAVLMATDLKTSEPDNEVEETRPVKRKLNETIFCLVSIPVQLQANKKSSDQNNNEPVPQPTEKSNNAHSDRRLLMNQSLQSTSWTGLQMQPIPSGVENGKAARKVCVEKDPVDTQSLKPSKHVGLRCSGSWPGDQYRDQETQTSFMVAHNGFSQGCPRLHAEDQSLPICTTMSDSSLITDGSSMYRFQAMKGHKSLNPSSNSAFSKTSTYSNQFNKSTVPSGSPIITQKETNRWSPQKTEVLSSVDDGHEAFGQFLLKPVNRRPCDAIEELESFNKELQDQFGKQVGVDKCLVDLDDTHGSIQDSSITSSNPENDDMHLFKATLETTNPADSIYKSNKTKPTFNNWNTVTDPEHKEVKSAFSRPSKAASFSNRIEKNMTVMSEDGITNYSAPSGILRRTGADWRTIKQDVHFHKESIDVDVSRQPSCKMFWATKDTTQDTSILTSPPDNEDFCHGFQLKQESRSWNRTLPLEMRARNEERGSPLNFYEDLVLGSDSKQESILWRTDTEIHSPVNIDKSISQFTEELSSNAFTMKGHWLHSQRGSYWIINDILTQEKDLKGVSHTTGIDSNNFGQKSQLSAAERHLETLLKKDKGNVVPVEDLTGLYEVKCAKGIPQNETIEQRAARILGIDVPAESLHGVHQKEARQIVEIPENNNGEGLPNKDVLEPSGNENMLHLTMQYEKEDAESLSARECMQKMEVREPKSVTIDRDCINQDSRLADEFPTDETKCMAMSSDEDKEDCSVPRNKNSSSYVAETMADEEFPSTFQTGSSDMDLAAERRHFAFKNLSLSGDEEVSEPEQQPELKGPCQPNPRPRGGTVAKREITLPPDLYSSSNGALVQDMELLMLSDSYDPSHVEKV